MLTLFVRAIIIYVVVFIIIRLSGKKQLSALSPFDLVMSLLIADIAAQPLSDPSVPIGYGLVPVAALFLFEKLISCIALKSETFHTILSGKPLIIINKGKVDEKLMRLANYTMQDLLEHLRTKDIFDISQVAYAVLETGGSISVLKKSEYMPVSCSDMNMQKADSAMCRAIIVDGKVMQGELCSVRLGTKWLEKQLKKCSLKSPHQVLYAILCDGGILCMQAKEEFGGKMYSIQTEANL